MPREDRRLLELTNQLAANRAAAARGRKSVILNVGVKDIIGQLSDQVTGELSEILEAFSDSVLLSSRRRTDLESVHAHVAANAQQAVIRAYQDRPGNRRPSYRWNDAGKLHRYANKAMEEGLRSGALITYDSRGINFINKSVLDQKAKQWYRLNFGALPKGSSQPPITPMTFFGKRIDGVGLVGFGPSEPFLVPETARGKGFWSSTFAPDSVSTVLNPVPRSGNHRDALYLWFGKSQGTRFTSKATSSKGKKRAEARNGGRVRNTFKPQISRGITGTRFLDAGTEAINRTYPPLLEQVIDIWIDEAKIRAAASARGSGVKFRRKAGDIF